MTANAYMPPENRRPSLDAGGPAGRRGSAPAPGNTASPVSGRRLLATLGCGLAAAAGVGTVTYYLAHLLAPGTNAMVWTQVIVVEVYALLTLAVLVAFRPVWRAPLALRFTSLRDLGIAVLAWVGIVAVSAVVYLVLRPAFGTLPEALRKMLTLASDVKRLQGQPALAWALAVPRGCLLVPLFEELFFRGVVLEWFRRRFSDGQAVLLAAVLFAATSVYPIVMPYALVFGVFTGWIRIRTGSTLPAVSVHVLNNLVSLGLAFWLLR